MAARTHSAPTLAVAPASPKVGDALVFTGTGYTPNTGVTIEVLSPYASSWSGAIAGADGSFSSEHWGYTAEQAGLYTAETWQGGHGPAAIHKFTVQ